MGQSLRIWISFIAVFSFNAYGVGNAQLITVLRPVCKDGTVVKNAIYSFSEGIEIACKNHGGFERWEKEKIYPSVPNNGNSSNKTPSI